MKSNKELKDAYKQKKFSIGVFQIRNTVNGKVLVSSSVNLDAIFNRIRAELKFNGHRNEQLQKEWNAFGEEKFKFEVLSEIGQEENDRVDYESEVKKLEAMFIEEIQPFGEKGYNTFKA